MGGAGGPVGGAGGARQGLSTPAQGLPSHRPSSVTLTTLAYEPAPHPTPCSSHCGVTLPTLIILVALSKPPAPVSLHLPTWEMGLKRTSGVYSVFTNRCSCHDQSHSILVPRKKPSLPLALTSTPPAPSPATAGPRTDLGVFPVWKRGGRREWSVWPPVTAFFHQALRSEVHPHRSRHPAPHSSFHVHAPFRQALPSVGGRWDDFSFWAVGRDAIPPPFFFVYKTYLFKVTLL